MKHSSRRLNPSMWVFLSVEVSTFTAAPRFAWLGLAWLSIIVPIANGNL